MYSRFIVERPVLTGVISIVIIIAGLVTLSALPVDLYPDIVPPTVTVTAIYPGADAKTLADTVATVIEQQVNGVENMLYMSSTSASDGTYTLTVTFDVGTDLDMAQVLVQNRVAIAEPQLPEEVKRQGITTLKKSTNFVLVISLYAPDPEHPHSDLDLNNYASIHINDVLKRVDGVGDVTLLGGKDYGMRIWMDPNQLRVRNLTVKDVTDAIKAQNVQVAAGSIGEPPTANGQQFQYTVTVMGRLTQAKEFANIVIKVGDDGQVVRVKDIGSVERGAKTYNSYSQLNNKPAATILVYQLPGSNAIDIGNACKAEMKRLAVRFPQGMKYKVSYDFTNFITSSIREITVTLFQAVGLVVLITFVFLQDWRACIVPTVTVPVSLIGTFLAMKMLGFSVNTLTMFGLVLAIGVVVDDSIVVVENTQRKIDDGMNPREAAAASLTEVMGPCIATTLVLLSVFVPTAFMGGITGRLYKQFALTISASTVFSTINALTLSPALCGILLRPTEYRNRPTKNPITLALRVFFGWFNKGFGFVQSGYNNTITVLIRRTIIMGVVFLIILGLTGFGFASLPGGFIPEEDQGYYMGIVQLPDASSLQRTSEVLTRVNEILLSKPGVADVISVGGYSLIDQTTTSNQGSFICVLDPWDKREKPELHVDAILAQAQKEFNQIEQARINSFNPPAIPGLGNSGGLQMQLEIVGTNVGLNELQNGVYQLTQLSNAQPDLTTCYSTFRANVPQYKVNVDRTKVMATGVNLKDLFDAMQAYMGSLYVNDFNEFGKTYQVRIQAESSFRTRPGDIEKLEVRTNTGLMAPIGTFVKVVETTGPQVINRYNMYKSALVMATPAEGYSSGQSMATMGNIVKDKLPKYLDYEWTGISLQQSMAAGQAPFIFALGAVFVYLFLAAQYESFLLPISVMLSIPFALLGAIVATGLRGYDNNIYTQVGIVILIGLASKTSILIVEFAKARHEEGLNRVDAAVEAGKLRFRAILMTAFSDIFGWTPLVIAMGAGSSSRKALGTAVFGGMIAATVIGLLFVPALYVIVQAVGDYMDKRNKEKEERIKQEMSQENS